MAANGAQGGHPRLKGNCEEAAAGTPDEDHRTVAFAGGPRAEEPQQGLGVQPIGAPQSDESQWNSTDSELAPTFSFE